MDRIIKTVEIDGNSFSNLIEFYDEIERKFTKGLNWRIGRNLDAFNDVMRGGFGVYEYLEDIEVIWLNSTRSKKALGYLETMNYLNHILKTCHPLNREIVQKELDLAKKGTGDTLFEIILEIIKDNSNIKLILN
jgi:RNAse (barnase) inhibitor barstar